MDADAKRRIAASIEQFGRHIYSIQGGGSPRFSYTIGLTEQKRPELVLAGAATIPTREVGRLLNLLADDWERGLQGEFEFESFGRFRLGPVHPSWTSRMLLRALEHYAPQQVSVCQVKPAFECIDVPAMDQPYSPTTHPVWQWLDGGWPYAVAPDSVAVTNLDALQGYAISELARWEEQEWEMFSGAGPEIPREEIFRVPLGTLLAFDRSLEAALELAVGTGLYREHDEDGRALPWKPWTCSQRGIAPSGTKAASET